MRIPDVLYHGTPEPFEAFRDPTGAKDRGAGYDHQGPAIYLTSDAHGYARFFACESIPRLLLRVSHAGDREREARLDESWGVILRVHLPDARILPIRQASLAIRDLFDRSIGRREIGWALRQAVLDAGYDALAFVEPSYPEGWEVKSDSTTVAVYNHEKALVLDAKDAQDYKLPSGWSQTLRAA